VVWHFYHVIFDPDVYPLNWACWSGKVSKHWQEEEHPLDNCPTQGSLGHNGSGAVPELRKVKEPKPGAAVRERP
jgi:hypothetical protein